MYQRIEYENQPRMTLCMVQTLANMNNGVCEVSTLWLNAVLINPKAKAHPVIHAEIKDSTSRYIVVDVLSTCLSLNQDGTIPEVKDLDVLNPL